MGRAYSVGGDHGQFMVAETDFIKANTVLTPPSAVPELTLWLATEVTPLWQATEVWLQQQNCPPPYWAFVWAGGQALARYVLDHPEHFAGKRVIDFATGSGIVAIAAAKAGAVEVLGTEIDHLALAATRLNAVANDVAVEARQAPWDDPAFARADIILAADICYEQKMTAELIGKLRQLAVDKLVLLSDPGRAYLPKTRLEELTSYVIPTSFDLENVTERRTTIYRLLPQ